MSESIQMWKVKASHSFIVYEHLSYDMIATLYCVPYKDRNLPNTGDYSAYLRMYEAVKDTINTNFRYMRVFPNWQPSDDLPRYNTMPLSEEL